MEITTEKTYRVTLDISKSELDAFVGSVEGSFSAYLELNKDPDALNPLLSLKDLLVTSVHNAER